MKMDIEVIKKPDLKIPKTIGACADELFEIKTLRLQLQRVVDALSTDETTLKNHIINTLPKTDTGAAGKLARVSVETKTVPQVANWDKLYAYIKKTGSFDLLHKRLSDKAVTERWESKRIVPGVEEFQLTTVSLNKI